MEDEIEGVVIGVSVDSECLEYGFSSGESDQKATVPLHYIQKLTCHRSGLPFSEFYPAPCQQLILVTNQRTLAGTLPVTQ